MTASSEQQGSDVREAAPDRRVGPRLARAAVQIRGDGLLVVLDLLITAVTLTLLYAIRFDFAVPGRYLDKLEVYVPVACVVQVLANWAWGCYGRTWRHASIDEARRLLCAGASAGIGLFLVFAWGTEHVPYSVLVAGPVVVTFLCGLVRFQSRLFAFNRFGDRRNGVRVAVVGAGSTGSAALREVRESPQLGLVPVVAVDDDPTLRGRQLHGVPIAGGVDELAEIIRDRDVNQVLYAMPSAPPSVLRKVADAAEEARVPVRVLPAPSSWVHGMPHLRDLRDLRIEDLLRRPAVDIDLAPVRELLAGRRVLVTGGGGWIGAEIARQVAGFSPARLVLLDHDETHLHDSRQEVATPGDVAPGEIALGDIRDASAMEALFERVRPEVVFHAAAHKHVSILEDHACEAILTNILGTANIVEASARSGVTHLVCISTDKAATPSGVMGASKWVAEQVVLARAPQDHAYCSVRFGNVLGSRGSVIPTFQRQIAAGGPVTVTDPAMTRFFMSTDEAVRLVLRAAAVTCGRRVLALEMGEQVDIYELAERMIRLCGYQPGVDIPITITGALPGENLAERVVGPAEHRDERADGDGPIVTIAPVPIPSAVLEDWIDRLETLAVAGDHHAARTALLELTAPALADLAVARDGLDDGDRLPAVETRS
ncbi:MAG TPA: nucleoside-diphosphate sugar epimerase/dehydratase [Acidimicrobiia bacterium]|nr:nucleoside-diphosphate sugar epimerase/dehydratase [Acidimicrobiia bacterium]